MQYADITDTLEHLKEETNAVLLDTTLDYLFNETIETMARLQEDTMTQSSVTLITDLKVEALLVVSGSNLQEGVTQRLAAVFDNAIAQQLAHEAAEAEETVGNTVEEAQS